MKTYARLLVSFCLATVPFAAQANYSVSFVAGNTAFANHLDHVGGNGASQLFPNAQDGDVIFKLNLAGQFFQAFTYDGFGLVWNPSEPSINPGEGAFYNTATPFTNVFTGNAHTPSLPITLTPGRLYFLSDQTQEVGSWESIVGTAPVEGSSVYIYNIPAQPAIGNFGSWSNYVFRQGAWIPSTPSIPIGVSAMFKLETNLPPVITSQPQSTTNAAGSNATFSVTASGSAPLAYQWQFNATNLPGATAAALVRSNIVQAMQGPYRVIVTNLYGVVTSSVATLTVTNPAQAPAITQQPQSQLVVVGSNVTFTVGTTGTAPLNYQWRFEGTNITGATNSNFVIVSADETNSGAYDVAITNSAGSATSTAATLTVVTALYTITIQPGFNLIANQLDNFVDEAGKEDPDSGVPIIDNRAVVLLSNLPVGTFILKHIPDSDPFDPRTNSGAFLGLTNGPTGWDDPESQITMDPGEGIFLFNPLSNSFTLTFAGEPHEPLLPLDLPLGSIRLLSRQTNAPAAYEDIVGISPTEGTLLRGWDETNQNFVDYSFSVGVWAPAPPAVRVGKAAFVLPGRNGPNFPPSISKSPFPLTRHVGESATFEVIAVAKPPPVITWLKDGVPIGGANGPTLALNNLTAGDAAFYSAKALNGGGTVTSAPACLVIASKSPAGQFTIVNVIPNSQSVENSQNAEPNIAVNPGNPSQVVVSSFDSKVANQPYFGTVNGGTTWANFNSLTHGDTTVAWNKDGKLLASILFNNGNSIEVRSTNRPPFDGTTLNLIEAGSTYNGGGAGVVKTDKNGAPITIGVDQPWIEADVVGGNQRIYATFVDWDKAVAPVDPNKPRNDVVASLHYIDPKNNMWVQRPLDRGAPKLYNAPPVRIAVNQGRIYAIFTRLDRGRSGFRWGNLVAVRDDNGGDTTAGTEFSALGGAAGVDVPDNAQRRYPVGSFGLQRLQTSVSIAVNPANPDVLCVAYTTIENVDVVVGVPQLHVVYSTDKGATWNSKASDLPLNTSLPALAFSTNGTVGLLYTATNSAAEVETHFTQFTFDQLKNRFCDRTDHLLNKFPAGTPPTAGQPYIGDYDDLVAVGNMFYGTFSASNDPDPENYPEGVYFQRYVKVGTNVSSNFFLNAKGVLAKDAAGAAVPGAGNGVSIDPYFFAVPVLGSTTTINSNAVTGATWLQRPDLTPWGMDVHCTQLGGLSQVVADDFKLPTNAPITSLDIWGSWLNDIIDLNASFEVRIWSDVPGSPSHPGQLLWSRFFANTEPFITIAASNILTERFCEPSQSSTNQIIGTDTTVYRYHFTVAPGPAFVAQANTTYWLSVSAFGTTNNFGWKTCITNDHFQDDGVWGPQPLPAQWTDLHYPTNHPLYPLTADLSFAVNADKPPGPPVNPATNPITIVDKWLQIPDATTNGMDVRATTPKILADDFECKATGPITQIKIWGSWLNDQPYPNPRFCLGIWDDVPQSISNSYSHPGNLLCSNCFYLSDVAVTYGQYSSGVVEQFWDPNITNGNPFIGTDATIWEYTFNFPSNQICWQIQSNKYWVSITADNINFGLFGWKTCPTNWNDDAVYGHVDVNGNPLRDWKELKRPGTTNSVDLAFAVLTTQTNASSGTNLFVGQKYLQHPDLTPTGVDVLATVGTGSPIVADDFLCLSNGYITDIHIWGSWVNDIVDPFPSFTLSFWSDVKATNGIPSHPGTNLWTHFFPQGSYSNSLAGTVYYERFLDPSATNLFYQDTQVYQYDFLIPAAQAFIQSYSNVYWLSVSAQTPNWFGWKTCITNDHWNDDAAWSPALPGGPWTDLHYPPGHPYAGQTMDMAFALTTLGPRPTITILPGVTNIVIAWGGVGILQSASNVTGPWSNITTATTPYTVPLNAPRQFYRVLLP